MVAHACRNAGEVETGGFPRTHWLALLVELVRSLFTASKFKGQWSRKLSSINLWSPHAHTQVNKHTNTYICVSMHLYPHVRKLAQQLMYTECPCQGMVGNHHTHPRECLEILKVIGEWHSLTLRNSHMMFSEGEEGSKRQNIICCVCPCGTRPPSIKGKLWKAHIECIFNIKLFLKMIIWEG